MYYRLCKTRHTKDSSVFAMTTSKVRKSSASLASRKYFTLPRQQIFRDTFYARNAATDNQVLLKYRRQDFRPRPSHFFPRVGSQI